MIIFLSKFPCSGVPYSKGKLLEKVAWNQEPEPSWGSTVVLSGTVSAVQASLDCLFAFFPSLQPWGFFLMSGSPQRSTCGDFLLLLSSASR